MEQAKVILEGMSVTALIAAIEEIVRTELKEVTKEPEALFTREQAADYLHVGLSTLSKWTSEGRIICYGIGGRKYYKKLELDLSLEELKF